MSVDTSARDILNKLREKAAASGDGSMYGDRAKALRDIDSLLATPSIDRVRFLLAPTANLQELSIENGWSNVFLYLAGELEKLLGIN